MDATYAEFVLSGVSYARRFSSRIRTVLTSSPTPSHLTTPGLATLVVFALKAALLVIQLLAKFVSCT